MIARTCEGASVPDASAPKGRKARCLGTTSTTSLIPPKGHQRHGFSPGLLPSRDACRLGGSLHLATASAFRVHALRRARFCASTGQPLFRPRPFGHRLLKRLCRSAAWPLGACAGTMAGVAAVRPPPSRWLFTRPLHRRSGARVRVNALRRPPASLLAIAEAIAAGCAVRGAASSSQSRPKPAPARA